MQYSINPSQSFRVDFTARWGHRAARAIVTAWLASLSACQGGEALPESERSVARYAAALEEPDAYVQDFEGEDDGAWTPSPRFTMPSSEMLPGTQVLGVFSTTEPVILQLSDLTEHSVLTVEFDTHVLGEWDGEHFEVTSGDWSVATSFSNGVHPQSFPAREGEGIHWAQSGAFAVDVVDPGSGFVVRAVYRHRYAFAHDAANLELAFSSPDLVPNASFALDNVVVVPSSEGDPWHPACYDGLVIDDGNPCTVDTCDPELGVLHSPLAAGTSCSDGDVCNGVETCSESGQCEGIPLVVDDQNPCTDDVCDAVSGVSHTIAVGRACEDGDACTGGDSCDEAGACIAGGPLACDDGLFCNGQESCDPASGCVAGTAPALSDGVDCTDDSCIEETDTIVHLANHAACSDGDLCDGVELCELEMGCLEGTPPAVDDSDPCTTDACDALAGVSHVPTPPGSACGVNQYCDGGECLGFGQCATDLVVETGQVVTFDGACEIDSIVFAGGTLIVNGALRTGSVTMNSGGRLEVNGGGLLSETISLANGAIDVDGDLSGALALSGGTLRLGGRMDVPSASDFAQSGGRFVNDGVVTLPVFDATTVSGGTFVNRGRLDVESDALTVAPGATLSESGSLGADDHIGSLIVEGLLTHEPRNAAGAAPLGAGLAFEVGGDATVTATGAIDVSAKGLRGGLRDGNPASFGETYASDLTTIVNAVEHGASHGGRGGAGLPTYGSMTAPTLLGSGGGSVGLGGNGGGRVDLVVGGTLTIEGAVRANGGAHGGSGSPGNGGSGGSLRLRAGHFAGAGALSANGGDGQWAGGGGGRIAIEYGTRSATGSIIAHGGTAPAIGGAGSVYLLDTTAGSAELRLDNGGLEANPTVVSADGSFDRLTVASGSAGLTGDASALDLVISGGMLDYQVASGTPASVHLSGGTLNALTGFAVADGGFTMTGGTLVITSTAVLSAFDATTVTGGTIINRGRLDVTADAITVAAAVTLNESGRLGAADSIGALTVHGRLTHDRGAADGVAFTVAGDAWIANDGAIDVSAKGLRGGFRDGNTTMNGETYEADLETIVASNPHGGSYGGRGGAGPLPYGSEIAPVLFGSGGGSVGLGGNGGGRIDLVVNGTLTVDGALRADGGTQGSSGNEGNGGGGGSVRVRANHFAGSGALSARGGAGFWAGGGGGRIAVEYVDSSYTGTIDVDGAATGAAGAAGTTVLTPQSAGVAVPALEAAGGATCALDGFGQIDCWGDDADGVISDAPAGIYTALAMGSHGACALHRSGMPHCWGAGGDGALLHAPRTMLSAIGVGAGAACGARTADGGLSCWGTDGGGLLSSAPAGAFVDLAMTDGAACARTASGALHCWGSDEHGQVTGMPAAAVSQLDGGAAHFCAVASDGTITCWGDDASGQSTAPGGPYTQVTAGGEHSCALDELGAAVCWGANGEGQASPPGDLFDAIAAGGSHTCGVVQGGGTVCWGE